MGIIKKSCPGYYFNQSDQNVPVLQVNNEITVLDLEVTTEFQGERVKIDSMLGMSFITTLASVNYGFSVEVRLYRDETFLAAKLLRETEQVKQNDGNALIDFPVNLTWTDVPDEPGIYTYRLEVERLEDAEVIFVTVTTRSMNATVYPPINP